MAPDARALAGGLQAGALGFSRRAQRRSGGRVLAGLGASLPARAEGDHRRALRRVLRQLLTRDKLPSANSATRPTLTLRSPLRSGLKASARGSGVGYPWLRHDLSL